MGYHMLNKLFFLYVICTVITANAFNSVDTQLAKYGRAFYNTDVKLPNNILLYLDHRHRPTFEYYPDPTNSFTTTSTFSQKNGKVLQLFDIEGYFSNDTFVAIKVITAVGINYLVFNQEDTFRNKTPLIFTAESWMQDSDFFVPEDKFIYFNTPPKWYLIWIVWLGFLVLLLFFFTMIMPIFWIRKWLNS